MACFPSTSRARPPLTRVAPASSAGRLHLVPGISAVGAAAASPGAPVLAAGTGPGAHAFHRRFRAAGRHPLAQSRASWSTPTRASTWRSTAGDLSPRCTWCWPSGCLPISLIQARARKDSGGGRGFEGATPLVACAGLRPTNHPRHNQNLPLYLTAGAGRDRQDVHKRRHPECVVPDAGPALAQGIGDGPARLQGIAGGGAQRLAEKDVRSEIWELLKGGRLGLAAPRPLAGATRS